MKLYFWPSFRSGSLLTNHFVLEIDIVDGEDSDHSLAEL